MTIINNEQLNHLLAKHDEKTQLFVSELNTLNNEYFPLFTNLKKERGNRLYGMGVVICLLAFLSFMVIFGAIEPLKLIYLLYIITGGLLVYSLVLVFKTQKELKTLKTDWDQKYQVIYQIKLAAYEILAEIKEQILYVIATNEQKTLDEVTKMMETHIGSTLAPDEMIAYYEAWGKAKTGQTTINLDELREMRRKKAEIMTKKKTSTVNP
ncbi:MAG TPA: hypothetical protein PK087_01220 [Bacilli bacterium]|nr:MAG: hypothetical protein BWY97_00562 [Tenericutes bacterium ADurb.BinA124]HNZ50102.1 hypothetical protein [Bacilli bacterium]HOH17921.1 hypothetical protein [Bacilli bacterium]HPN60557.1 hypothetical protein [Bacilli bacterium]HPX84016.1 hypothetical protein [Bacilli bacterium]